MMIKDAKDARKAVGAGLKKKPCIGSKRVQQIYAFLKEKFEFYSQDTSAQRPFPGTEDDATVLKQALGEMAGRNALSQKTETALRPVFRRMGWAFPKNDEGTDTSRVFGQNHLWGRSLAKSLAQLEEDCRAGGVTMIEVEPADEAFLRGIQTHLESDGVSDSDLQKALGIIRRYVRRV